MTTHDAFLAYVNKVLKEHLESKKFSDLEKLGIKISIYDIFQENQDLEEIYYQLLDYLEKDRNLAPLVPRVEMYYLTSNK